MYPSRIGQKGEKYLNIWGISSKISRIRVKYNKNARF
uniref:Uncharacterized protein n=1 Tax=Siphoviridae sp. ctFSL3 TaxID=2825404 RepID=A0A8S5PEE6_9CAUD|nr:MAG TPA: hypothetical protein [Siphoviridae sp. ctFSL3]